MHALSDFTLIGGPVFSCYRITCVYILGHVFIINDSINHLNQPRLLRGPGNAQWLVITAEAYWAINLQWNSSILERLLLDLYLFMTLGWKFSNCQNMLANMETDWRMERQDIWSNWLHCFSTNKFRFLSLVSCLFSQCFVFATYLYLLK